jgi:hypothetical protein
VIDARQGWLMRSPRYACSVRPGLTELNEATLAVICGGTGRAIQADPAAAGDWREGGEACRLTPRRRRFCSTGSGNGANFVSIRNQESEPLRLDLRRRLDLRA